MLQLIRKKGLLIAMITGLLFSSASFADTAQTETVAQTGNFETWKQFHSMAGSCNVSFPSNPEHVRQVMKMPNEDTELQYDVYVSAHKNESVFMVLVAQYPPFINEEYAEQSLESFLNGILGQNAQSQLVFADLVEVQGNKALDFFIKTNGVYFKGRAIMAKNNLYFLAMECEMQDYKESHFTHFVNSFEIMQAD